MRKLTKKASMLLILFVCVATTAFAQQPTLQPLPIDSAVRYGVLPNGLTYYIRHNAYPENRADFYIAQNVGSVLEEEEQRGLAHFLEHMAFNGTKNFPEKSMLHYLETNGVKFGTNVNAYTGFDETVYNLSNVPVLREGMVDSCLLILHDWANAISLEEEEIDNERGVIQEEWRTRNSATQRMWEAIVPDMFVGSQYAHRMPIGTMDVVMNFPYQTLRDYYHKWYRPDLQGIIVVGDIDAARVEEQVIKLFSSIPMPEDAAPRTLFPVPDNDEPIITLSTDKENTNTNIMVFYKHDPMPREVKSSHLGLVASYMQEVIAQMFAARMSEIAQKPNAPFLAAYGYDSNFFVSKTKDAFTTIAISRNDGVEEAFAALLRETARVDRYGFTASEYDRARADYLTLLESAYKERDKQRNESYVNEYIAHFTEGEPIPSMEMTYQILNQLIPSIPVESINSYIQEIISDHNMVIAIAGVDAEGVIYPSKEELRATLATTADEDLEPYVDSVSSEPLISELPTAGKVVATTEDKALGTTVWQLSNGATVVVKPTTFKEDEVRLIAQSKGGKSKYTLDDRINLEVFDNVVSLGGVGNFSALDLQKVLAGKNASVNLSLGSYSETLTGSSTPKDIETMMQLLYLNFTQLHKDEDAFASWIARAKSSLENAHLDPQKALSDSLMGTLYDHSPWIKSLEVSDLDRVDYDRILTIWSERFASPSDFVFTLVGNLDLATLKPLVEQYIGGLPSGSSEERGDIMTRYTTSSTHTTFDRPSQADKSSVYAIYSGKTTPSLEREIQMSMLSQIMDIVYTRTIREEEGGTYGVGTQGSINRESQSWLFLFRFDTNPELRDKLLARAQKELLTVVHKGASQEDLDKVKRYMLKRHKELLLENGYWLGALNSYYFDQYDKTTTYQELVEQQTVASLRAFTQQLFDQSNEVEVIMNLVAE